MACATRAVSSGIAGIGCGCMDIDSLLFFSILLVIAKYLIFLSHPALRIRQQYLSGAVPSIQMWQSKAAPPNLIGKSDGPRGLLAGPSHQSITSDFFCKYLGSGLVIQRLARFQLVLSLLRARRTLSVETRVAVIPCWKLTEAAISNVH